MVVTRSSAAAEDTKAKGESYLVIGGCGFLGRYIVEQLLERGETQVAVFDLVQRHFDTNVTFYIGDISKEEDVVNAITKSNATAIIHTASPAHGLGAQVYELVNVIGTRNVIDASIEHGVKKLVYTSSAGVIYNGIHDITSADERLDFPIKPLDAYNHTKVQAEKMVLSANSKEFKTCAIRPAGLFGPGDRQVIQGFYNVIKNGQTRFQIGDNNNLNEFTYVANAAHAHLLAIDKLDTTYPYSSFRDPIPSIDLSLGGYRIPTSEARPLGPNTEPTERDLMAARKFESGQDEESDLRPVLRNRMDQFASEANELDQGGCPIAGQAFFVTNGEPTYFWDFARTVWRELGADLSKPPFVIPTMIGMLIAALAEIYSKLMEREAGFTKFRVAIASQNRYYDIERARRLLGYEPVIGLEEGMRRWTEWYKTEMSKMGQAGETAKTK
ncbi:hypothetical protein TREMEDRAFT_67694 [Tremella mesenterica DSM 1558]|uniref:uncharacterized protein n=1 Tax=Tremella mesenterica (strain ATCC 24925 / CBS 8224 / DSM 1558 / NBRC 9311 / NRRL Y-6157 / RJB 2259-6 / UBC 559-6) TaxID=578456 RepID=UPI0003F49D27|nr:uncharacterized protein TREMEDRAFT_67694 [Tremella mesenterica DSM 1558]EIW71316.1 hypothetical protein TREMEDRAFT_67694 [Tremella mesenterica DSM 1558]